VNKPTPICIGNQSAFSATRLLEPFEYAVANGFNAFEWFPDKRLFGGMGGTGFQPGPPGGDSPDGWEFEDVARVVTGRN